MRLKLGLGRTARPDTDRRTGLSTVGVTAAVATALAVGAALLAVDGPAAGINTNRTGTQDGRGFPTFYTDDAGLALQICEDGTAACLNAVPGDLTPPDGENFFWTATATVPTRRGDLDVVFGLEAAFGTAGRPIVFDRLRIRGHLSRAGTYVLQHPFGSKRFQAASPGEQRNVNDTVDLGCSLTRRGPCRARIDGWLRSKRVRVGYIGRGAVPTRVVGGTARNSIVIRTRGGRVIGRTKKFSVVGKLAPGPAAAVSKGSVDVGNTTRRQNRTVVIRNLGTGRLNFRRFRIHGDKTFHVRRVPSTCGARTRLASGRTCKLRLRYRPDGRRLSTARLVFRDNTAGHLHRIPLRAMTAARLSARNRMHFTARHVGSQSHTRRVVVENSGVKALRFKSVSLRGRSFVRHSGRGPLCAAGLRLRPGRACAVYVAFSPRTFGRKSAHLVMKTNALSSPDRVRLNGRGR